MHRPSRRCRVAIAAISTLAVLASSGAVDAEEPPAPQPIGAASRFSQYAVPGTLDLSNLPSRADDDQEVAAIVTLVGDSVIAANADAAATDQRLDPAAAQRQVADEQQVVGARLQAAGATIDGNITTVLNAVRVRVKVRDLAGLAGVAGVSSVHVSRTITLDNAASNAYTGVNAVWADLGVAGDGITIAVIDDGIDYYHADFAGVGGQAAFEADDGLSLEPGTFPTAKVVAGYDFAGDAYDAEADEPGESTVPVPDPDPLACGDHGTHVAGTAAGFGVLAGGATYTGPYDATTMTNQFLVAPGSAPQALLQSYKVFGCSGSSDEGVILAAIEAAVENGADVVNMSLGSSFGSADEPLAIAIDAASAAGVVMVLSAGNEGPGAYVLGGPSSANSAISVAAVDAVPSIPGVDITGAVTVTAQNSNAYEFTESITGNLVDVGLGCVLEDYADAVGQIAVTTRGDCDRVARAVLGTQAGAAAVVFINNAPGLPPVEGVIPDVTVPFVGVTPETGEAMQAAEGESVTLSTGPAIANPSFQSLAGFTSNGPRIGDSGLKPDIAAPGVNVLSAGAGTGTGGILLSGTSMASPHTAGIAALVLQTHPGWDPTAIKGAMMGTAAPEGVADYSAQRAGAGLVDARSAVDTVAFVSTKDGTNNLSFGFRELTNGVTVAKQFRITNTSGAAITYDLTSSIDDDGIGVSAKMPKSVTVAAGHTRSVSVQLRISNPSLVPGAADSDGGALATVDGFVVATPRQTGTGIHRLVTPLLFVPSGLSNVRATPVRPGRTSKAAATPTRIKLYNAGKHSGDADFYQWAISDPLGDSPDPRVADIRDVAVQSFPFDETGPLLVFAVSTGKGFSTQSVFEYDIAIDTNGDDLVDFILIGADFGLLTTGVADGTMGSLLIAADGTPLSLFGAVAPANGSTVLLPVPAGAMGPAGLISFSAASFTVLAEDVDADFTDVGFYDPTAPAVRGVDPAAPGSDFPFIPLAPRQFVSVDVSVDRGAAHTQHGVGWLVVTTDDGAGAREADRVPLRP